MSVSRVTVASERVQLELELQTLSLLEVLPDLDTDGSGALDANELSAGKAPLSDYLARHYVLRTAGTRLSGELVGLQGTDADAQLAFVTQRVVAEFEFRSTGALTELELEVSLFERTSPDHRDYCTLAWEGQLEQPFTFSGDAAVMSYAPDLERSGHVRAELAGEGWRRGLSFELAGFSLALLVACRAARPALRSVLLYVLSAGLVLAVVSGFELALPQRLLALATALSVPYLAAENVLQSAPRTPWVEAALFGAVHGATLATDLAVRLAHEPLTLVGTSGYASGAGAALLVLAGGGTLVLRCLPGAQAAEGSLGPNWARRGASLVLALVGLWLFVKLAWFEG